jgi:hypothetical protein
MIASALAEPPVPPRAMLIDLRKDGTAVITAE